MYLRISATTSLHSLTFSQANQHLVHISYVQGTVQCSLGARCKQKLSTRTSELFLSESTQAQNGTYLKRQKHSVLGVKWQLSVFLEIDESQQLVTFPFLSLINIKLLEECMKCSMCLYMCASVSVYTRIQHLHTSCLGTLACAQHPVLFQIGWETKSKVRRQCFLFSFALRNSVLITMI